MALDDKVDAKKDQLVGKAKETAGHVTGDEQTEAKGKGQELLGKAKEETQKVTGKLSEEAGKLADKAKKKLDR
ncbi:CsbD family protein [Furfurilactobacillus sp. WILCCON 0119]|uniref:CsbD family protein n=1 Tax=Furfurilactobacillus entadae TaxID=2922307 RepID=UPI0035F036B3